MVMFGGQPSHRKSEEHANLIDVCVELCAVEVDGSRADD